MLRGLDDFMKKPQQFKRKFLTNCEIQEKVSAFYFHARILSETTVILYKSDYQEIKPEDVIMNKMWREPIEEIPEILLKHPEVTRGLIGYTLSFFYFPVGKPLIVDYSNTDTWNGVWKYMLGFAVDEKRHSLPLDDITKRLSSITPLVRSRGYILRKSNDRTPVEKANISDMVKTGDVGDVLSLIEDLIDNSDQRENILAKSVQDTEGIVLRWRGDIFQIVYNKSSKETKDNRLSLEFFMHQFCQWLSSTDYTDLIKQSYVKSVCNLFCEFKKQWLNDEEKMTSFKYYNISAEDLEAPTFGYYPGTCYDLIPHKLVREMCMRDKMCDNMLKILLNALKKPRKMPSSGSMLMTDGDIESWNNCVKFIRSYTNPIAALNKKRH